MEVLLNRMELLFWKCRKELFFGKLDALKKKYEKEQDDVLRIEGDFFTKLRKDHKERLAKEKEEVDRAKLELELAEKELAEMESWISALEMKPVSSIYNVEELDDMEKELHDWCKMMEKGLEAFSALHNWITDAETERLRVYSNPADREQNKRIHDALDVFFLQLDVFLSMVGRVRYLPGVRVNTGFHINRTMVMGGKTLMFFRKGYGTFQLDLHEFYLREMESGWATGSALEKKLKELEHLEKLCRGIMIEKLSLGEDVLRKHRINHFQTVEKDIFGFEKKN